LVELVYKDEIKFYEKAKKAVKNSKKKNSLKFPSHLTCLRKV